MNRTFVFLLVLALAAGCAGAVCISCGSGSSRMTMKWNISGATDERDGGVYCVGQAVSMRFKGLNTGRYLDGVKVYVSYNGSRVAVAVSGYDGIASFIPEKTGVYQLFAERRAYSDVSVEMIVGSCLKEASTTTISISTSSSTTIASTTSSTSLTTTSSTSSTSTTQKTQENKGNNGVLIAGILALAAIGLLAYLSRKKGL